MFRMFAFFLCMCGLLAAQPAAGQVDPRWGILGEMAERDYSYGVVISTWRWKIPDRVIVETQWGLGGHREAQWELDPGTGEIIQRVYGERHRNNFETARGFQIIADGTLTRNGKPFLSRAENGSVRWGSVVYELIGPGHKRESSVAKIVAAGKLRPANREILAHSPPTSIAQAPPLSQTFQAAPSISNQVSRYDLGTSGPRLALIMGNSAYPASMGALPNPANDASAMAAALQALGFKVTLVKNADQKSMRRAISAFGQQLSSAGPSATGLFFYAGHGIQAKGINYLIPTDANIQTQADVEMESVGADAVLEQMEEAGAGTNIVILDACRNMPLVRGFRSPTRGLAPMDAPNGSFIAYSTAPGSVAADGMGANSPFVTALVKHMGRKGESIESIFRNVRREVRTATENTQTPWDSSSLVEPFYFAGN